MTEDTGFRPFRVTATATDAYVAAGNVAFMIKAKLVAGAGAASTAQLVDANGTVLAELSAPAAGADWLDIPVIAEGKVRVGTLTGAGAIVMVYVN